MTASERPLRLFGTDGIRGIANCEPITSETALQLGRAVAQVFRAQGSRPKVVIGKDTRLSGYMLEGALTSGICSMGADALLVGPCPTPGIAFLTRSLRADAGVVLSASHNHFADNGIKFFARNGFKLSDELEAEIERLVLDGALPAQRPTGAGIGKAYRIDDALGRYNEFVKQSFPRQATLDHMRIALDCANGAAYRVAPEVFEELGARVVALGVSPDGLNINRDCGALYPQELQKAVVSSRAHLGIAFDGDGDRAVLVDEKGEIVDGDQVLAMLAVDLHRQGKLRGGAVVSTVMSNLGLELALGEHGIRLLRTPVGDRYVVDAMLQSGCNLGGEQSGHVVQFEYTTTGDGLITALSVLRLMVESGQPLSALKSVMRRLPQVLVNVRVRERRAMEELRSVARLVDRWRADLGPRARILVRYSGTEPLLRIMVEGDDGGRIEMAAREIAAAASAELGGCASE